VPRFETPRPIAVTLELVLGDVRLTASDRSDTVVDVRPANPADDNDVKAAHQVRVEFADGRLLVKASKQWRHYTPFGPNATVDVVLDVPTGSTLTGDMSMGNLTAEGELGDCRFKTAMGHLRVDHAGTVTLKTSHGNITVDRAAGNTDVSTGSGDVRLGEIDGVAVIRNSNGDTVVGTVTGDLRVKASNGDVAVERADRTVVARTASGDLRIGEIRRGAVELRTAAGEIEVGIRPGTAAYLDVHTPYGRIHNALDDTDGPDGRDETVEVRARTGAGDIVIRRSAPAATAQQLEDS
jgi:DUF4097 and DUF4098 domain-containing protein YvlB